MRSGGQGNGFRNLGPDRHPACAPDARGLWAPDRLAAAPPADEDGGDGDGAKPAEKVAEAEALASGGDAGTDDASAKLEPERAGR